MKKILAIFSCLGVDPETDQNADFSRQKCEKCAFFFVIFRKNDAHQRGLH